MYTVRDLIQELEDCDLDAEVEVRSVEDGTVVQTSEITEIENDMDGGRVVLIGELS
jgi:hypothetical protein